MAFHRMESGDMDAKTRNTIRAHQLAGKAREKAPDRAMRKMATKHIGKAAFPVVKQKPGMATQIATQSTGHLSALNEMQCNTQHGFRAVFHRTTSLAMPEDKGDKAHPDGLNEIGNQLEVGIEQHGPRRDCNMPADENSRKAVAEGQGRHDGGDQSSRRPHEPHQPVK